MVRAGGHCDQQHFEGYLRKGLMRDLVLGDPEFDRAFVVDCAPEDIARELLDAPTRAQMLALRPLAVRTEPRRTGSACAAGRTTRMTPDVSTVTFIVGAVGLGLGAFLWFGDSVAVAPGVGSLEVSGRF